MYFDFRGPEPDRQLIGTAMATDITFLWAELSVIATSAGLSVPEIGSLMMNF
jgi:hypothetical protein